MLHPLEKDLFTALPEEINELKTFPLINAVCTGQQSGLVFADKPRHPNVVFITNKAGFSYLWTRQGYILDYPLFLLFLESTPGINRYIHIYEPGDPDAFIATLPEERFGYKLRDRVQLQCWDNIIEITELKGISHKEINKDNIGAVSEMGLSVVSLFWDDDDHFLSGGYGVLLYSDDSSAVVCACCTACVAGNTAEVDIYTIPSFQNKGLARYATALFVQQCMQRGITPNWDCFEDNTPSLKTALGLGFEITKRYKYLSVYFKEKAV